MMLHRLTAGVPWRRVDVRFGVLTPGFTHNNIQASALGDAGEREQAAHALERD